MHAPTCRHWTFHPVRLNLEPVNEVLLALLSLVLATNRPAVASNLIHSIAGVAVAIPDPADPAEKEYRALLELDDKVMTEIDELILRNQAAAGQNAALGPEQLRQQIEAKLEPVRRAYEDFLRRYPNHARARLAYGSFLNDTRDEAGAVAQWEKALELDPSNPAAWNNLANYYGHRGPVKKAFEYYAKAIELNPFEPVYYHNLGTTVYLFRKDAMEFYGINEQQVFDKALELYNKALQLDPTNFVLATDIAQTYYGIRPFRADAAIKAWEYALSLAPDETARQGIHVHLARVKINAGRFDQARQHLSTVTNQLYDVLKNRLLRKLAEEEAKQPPTNAPVGIKHE
ncbi:MAG: tetratricopeptide repeat protein [Verrucomicrobiae bacterium]|nr:tetratricopeptide repeat protein [Verrucomicrobiae bacterium]